MNNILIMPKPIEPVLCPEAVEEYKTTGKSVSAEEEEHGSKN